MQTATKVIFISHASADRTIAEAICKRIESQGFLCWIAPRDIAPGKIWGNAIIEAIDNSRVMIVVFSLNSNGSQHVLREVERAISKEKLIIIPMMIQSIQPTGAMEYFLKSLHWFDASNPPVEDRIDELSKTIKAIFEVSDKHLKVEKDFSKKDYAMKLETTINPSHTEEINEFIAQCQEVLLRERYESISIDDISCVIYELLSNSAEHGCNYDPDGKIEVLCEIYRSYTYIKVHDSGKGFNPESTLKILSETDDICRERGRGLLLVKFLCHRVDFSDSGRKVEVVILNKKSSSPIIKEYAVRKTRIINNAVVITFPRNQSVDLLTAEVEMMIDQSYKNFAFDWEFVRATKSDLVTCLFVLGLRKITNNGGKVVFFNVNPHLYDIFKKLRINEVFPIKYSLQDALAYLKSNKEETQ